MSDKFVTKDSGERQTFPTGMQRDSGQKDLRPDLLPGDMLVRWAELMGRGAKKYKARNWEKARTEEELERFREGAFRHFVQWFYGLDTEEDHAAAVFFNISGAEHVKARLAAQGPKIEPAPVVTPWQPKVGDLVTIPGGVGKIVDTDNASSCQWFVQFGQSSYRSNWFDTSELSPLSLDAAKARVSDLLNAGKGFRDEEELEYLKALVAAEEPK